MKELALLLLFLGVICVTIGYSRMENCPMPKTEYRYIPDYNLLDTQMSPTHVSDTFHNMFEKDNPDVRGSIL